MKPRSEKRNIPALEAQRKAHEIAFAPIVFQVSRLMLEYGIFQLIDDNVSGLTVKELSEKTGISEYGLKVLLESSLTAGTVCLDGDRFTLSKTGWFLLNDPMVKADIDFNHYVNYKGMYHLDEAIRTGKPAGLKELGQWPTIYEGLSQFDEQTSAAWFGFDHFYSDNSFEQALPRVFSSNPERLLDIGGNTGRFALQCVEKHDDVNVTIMDLPGQISLMKKAVYGKSGAERISGYPADLLDEDTVIPGGFDVVWMSQFLDCFSEEQVKSILARVAKTLKAGARVFIMENLWDRQRFGTASFDLAQTSVYFTAMANGNSKLFYSKDLLRMIEEAGLSVVSIDDMLGYGHSLIECIGR